jgi:superfamily II DNA or RNA helicase
MKLTLKNHIEITEIDDFEQDLIELLCTHDNPKFAEAQRQGYSTRTIPRQIRLFERIDNGLIIPMGLLPYVEDGVFTASYSPEIIDRRNRHPVTIPFTGQLRGYQERFITGAMDSQGGVLVAATGAGKTVSGIALASRLGQRCLILVKSKDLAEQWKESIQQFTDIDAGLIGGGKNTEDKQFTIGLVQSLVKRDLSKLDYGLVIADECHNAPASQSYQAVNGINARYKYGLSATPQRRDSLEFMIFAALGEICAEIEPGQLEGKVLPVTVQTIEVGFSGEVDCWGGFINALIDDGYRNDYIVRLAQQQTEPTIILCSQVRHCEILTTLTAEAGLRPLLIHGQLPTKVRSERMAAAQNARLIIGTAQLLGEGLDIPHLQTLIFATPMSAVIDKEGDPAATKLIQSIGRCRRPYPGKTHAHIIDIVDKCGFGVAAYKKRRQIYRLQGFGWAA